MIYLTPARRKREAWCRYRSVARAHSNRKHGPPSCTLWGRILYFNTRAADLGVQPADDVEIQDLTPSDGEVTQAGPVQTLKLFGVGSCISTSGQPDLDVLPTDDVEIQDLTPSDWEGYAGRHSPNSQTLWGRILYFNIRAAHLGVQPTGEVEIQDLTPR